MEKHFVMKIQNLFSLGLLLTFLTVTAYAENVVLACNEFPPFKMEKSDTGLPGFDVEFLKEAFKRSNIELEIKYYPWKRALRLAEEGTVTGLCSCSKSPGREKFLVYSDLLGHASSGLFSLLQNHPSPKTDLSIVNGHSVGVVSAYNLEKKLVNSTPSRVDHIPNETLAANMFLNNRFDYYYAYEAPARFYLKKLSSTKPTTYTELDRAEYYACFSKKFKGYETYLQKFNEGLASIKQDGTYEAIMAKYR
jgi:polar amino acid transport system substrate-binding protein